MNHVFTLIHVRVAYLFFLSSRGIYTARSIGETEYPLGVIIPDRTLPDCMIDAPSDVGGNSLGHAVQSMATVRLIIFFHGLTIGNTSTPNHNLVVLTLKYFNTQMTVEN